MMAALSVPSQRNCRTCSACCAMHVRKHGTQKEPICGFYALVATDALQDVACREAASQIRAYKQWMGHCLVPVGWPAYFWTASASSLVDGSTSAISASPSAGAAAVVGADGWALLAPAAAAPGAFAFCLPPSFASSWATVGIDSCQ